MLLELKVHNLAIIESVEIQFSRGLNVLTGETGAGKSILLAALDLLLGGRSDKDLIRTGKEEAWAEATFEMEEKLAQLLQKLDLPYEPTEPLSLRRVIQANGRSRSYINCASVPATVLKQIAPYLLDFSRQHEQSILLNAEQHLFLLDHYGALDDARTQVETAYEKLKKMHQEYEDLVSQIAQRADRTAFLNFQLKGILSVNPQEDEEEELHDELKKLSETEERRKLAQQVISTLKGDDTAARERLSHGLSTLRKLVALDSSLSHVFDDLENALIATEEAASTLTAYRQNAKFNADRMKEIQERLDEIIEIQNKYGGSFATLTARRKEMEKELKVLEEKEKRLTKLAPLIAEGKAKLYQIALPLSRKRREIANRLAAEMLHELSDLAMTEAQFETRFSDLSPQQNAAILCPDPEKPGQTRAVGSCGLEQASFWLSANPGEELRPLAFVASGGELSRILLALKHVMAKILPIQTFVFDEIDSGVSGTAAALIAQKLRDIIRTGDNRIQIIAISHTAQTAAEADCHFYVEKQTKEGRTGTQVRMLDRASRLEEIARMLAGGRSQEAARELAKQMIRPA